MRVLTTVCGDLEAQLERGREVEEYRRRLEGRGRQPEAGGRVKL